MGRRLSDDERALLSRLLEDEDEDEDEAGEAEEAEEADEFTYRGRRYRAVPDEEDETEVSETPARKPVAKKAPAKKAAAPDPGPARKRRFVT
jgi:hypothetical protein